MLMAGLDGNRKQTDRAIRSTRNIYDFPPEEAGKIRQVPARSRQR